MTWLGKVHGTVSELSLAGWVAPDMLYTGLKAAGTDFTREKVVAALNKMRDYTAGGILPGIDWTKAHTSDWNPPCWAMGKVEGHEFVPQYTKPRKPFLCWPSTAPATLQYPTYKG
jgi:hypothetical protein